MERATFNYRDSSNIDPNVKAVLAQFDLDKTGQVTTRELVAGVKALQEVRALGAAGGPLPSILPRRSVLLRIAANANAPMGSGAGLRLWC